MKLVVLVEKWASPGFNLDWGLGVGVVVVAIK